MTTLADLVELALTSHEAKIRQEYEAKLLQFRSTQPEVFMKDCIKEFQNTNLKSTTRQGIATIFTMTISNEMVFFPKNNKIDHWQRNLLEFIR